MKKSKNNLALKLKGTLVLALLSLSFFAQTAPKIFTKDFNEDGTNDDLVVNYFLDMVNFQIKYPLFKAMQKKN